MAVVQILIADVDLTEQVVFRETEFISAVNGTVGTCRLLIRDETATLVVVTGSKLELLIDGDPVWTGFVTTFERTYVFPAINVADFGLSRFFRIAGVDLNTLFNKRIAYTKADPEDVFGKLYPPGTADIDVIADLVADYLDLSGDDLDTTTKVENVGDINVDQDARAWLASDSFGQAMASIASLPGAVYFLDPARFLVYTDANTANAPFGLSDQPSGGDPVTYFSDAFGGTDPSQWVNWPLDSGQPIGTASASEGSGEGRIDVALAVAFEEVEVAMTADLTTNMAGVLDWRVTIYCAATPVTGAGMRFGFGIDDYSFGLDVTIDEFASAIIQPYGAGFDDSDPFVWDTDPQVVEVIHTSLGEMEARIWPQSGSRPSTPTAAFTEGSPTPIGDGLVINFYGIAYSGVVPIVGSGEITVTSVVADSPAVALTVGYREMTITRDGSSLANDVLAWGIGYGSQSPVFVRDQDAPSQAEHGVWQLGTQRNGIYKQDTIDRVAASIVDGSPENLRGAKDDKVSVNLVTYVAGFLPAQKVDFTSAVWDFNDVIPIRRMRVTFDAPDLPKYELNLSHAIDAPWSFFDQYLLKLPKLPRFNFGCNDIEPEPIQTLICFPDIAPPVDRDNGWGEQWSGNPPSLVADEVVDPEIYTSDSVLWWTWSPFVSDPTSPRTTAGAIRLSRGATVGPYENIRAKFYITATSDETGDIDDAMVNSETTANDRGSMGWDFWLGTLVGGLSGIEQGLKITSSTGASFQDRVTHLSTWYPNAGGTPSVGPQTRIGVGPGTGGGIIIGGMVSQFIDFNTAGGVLDLVGDPTQLVVTFTNDADASVTTKTIPTPGGPLSYSDYLQAWIEGGTFTPDVSPSAPNQLWRAFLTHYQFSITQLLFQLWDGDAPPEDVWCGPIYSPDFTPVPTRIGCPASAQRVTKLSATQYATAYAFVPNSLLVLLSGLIQRRGIDYAENAPNKFTFTSPVDSAEEVMVFYQTAP